MSTNIEAYRDDLNRLVDLGNSLYMAIQFECHPEEFRAALGGKKKAEEFIKKLPDFKETYQSWYSEAVALIRQLLPDRLEDFKKHYEKPKYRKNIGFENYRIEDCLQGLVITRYQDRMAGPESAIPHVRQQVAILQSVKARFESSLFDIKQLVMADLFDSELESAKELSKKGFLRAGGALAGVILEKHLAQVMTNHGLKSKKKHPCISDYNDHLKNNAVIDTPIWRNIQRLGDIRNLCDHSKDREPTPDEVEELLSGVEKITKTK